MKNIFNTNFVFLLLVVCGTTAISSCARPQNDFETSAADGSVTITKYTGGDEKVVVPAKIGGLPVTVIGQNAFYDCDGLTSIKLPASVTVIEAGAFAWCINLTNCTLPRAVTSIGRDAFTTCSSLTHITIPAAVTEIGESAFAMCSSLTDFTIPASVTTIGSGAFSFDSSLSYFTVDDQNNNYASLEGVIFDKSIQTLIACPAGKSGTYTIPSSVTQIAETAFTGCRNLSNVIMPSSVTVIGESAFYSCSNLTDITIPASVTAMGKRAFSFCDSLNPATRAEIQDRFGDAPLHNSLGVNKK
ncbi:MAG: hypothetical protein Ta2G_19020 [Termitinemataceae bacterium]|nr:MAG: hypothetical protein Ta2G_19020 [Termitinemataceae bacterium]